MVAKIKLLGQSGVRFEFGETVVYVDPYLTEYVRDVERSEDLRRLIPIPFPPEDVRDADFVMITHAHMDHCDPTSVLPMTRASPGARVICPEACRRILRESGLEDSRIITALEEMPDFRPGLSVRAVPAAHPEIVRDAEGRLECVGYVITHEGARYYHAGDTSVAEELIAAVRRIGPIDVALLPVNERNFYRARRGIVGNMSVREAFQLAEDLAAKKLIPCHWDMFAPNRVYPEEIELLYARMRPSFELHMSGESL